MPRMNVPVLGRWIIFLMLAATRGWAAEEKTADTNAAWLAENYTKYEHRIPMRDGARLFTRVYVPKDETQSWPILLTRTPYALKPYGADNYNDPSGSFATLARDHFILVAQDVRGRFASEG
jgi:predicted acyl esterase